MSKNAAAVNGTGKEIFRRTRLWDGIFDWKGIGSDNTRKVWA